MAGMVARPGRRSRWVAAAVALASSALVLVVPTPAMAAIPVVSTQPPAEVVAALGGATVSITAAATGSPTPTVQWETSTDEGTTWAPMPGKTSATLSGIALTDLSQAGATRFRAAFTNSFGTTRTTTTTLRQGIPPSFTQLPTPTAPWGGGPATFTVAGSGTPAPTISWLACPFGCTTTVATGPSFTVTPPASGSALYAVRLTNAVGSVLTTTFPIASSGWGPVVSSEETTRYVVAGDQVVLDAGALGHPTPTVQWRRQGLGDPSPVDVPGATGPTLSLTPTALDDGARYRAVVTTPLASRTGGATTLEVGALAPRLTRDPVDVDTAAAGTVTFTAGAIGAPTPTASWARSDDGGATWQELPGAGASTLSIEVTASDDGARFRATFANAEGTATTRAAVLSVGRAPSPVLATPASQTVPVGGTASFGATASGYPAPSLRWQRSIDGTWTDIAGADSSDLSFTATAADHGSYRVVATNAKGSTASAAVALLVGVAPTFEAGMPPDGDAASWTDLVLHGSLATGDPSPTYRWQSRPGDSPTWTDIPGATSPTLTTTQYTYVDLVVRYRLIATNRVGSATSSEVTYHWGMGPSVRTHPQDRTVDSGQTATFRAEISVIDEPNDTYHPLDEQWERSTDGGATWELIPGATGDLLTLPVVTAAMDGHRFRARAANRYGAATTRSAALTVRPIVPGASDPLDVDLVWSGTATFTSAGTGDPAPDVRWQQADSALGPWVDLDGATSPTLSFAATRLDDGRWYRAVWTSSAGSHETAPAQLRVADAPYAAPTLAGSVAPTPNAAGWNRTPVTVSFACTSEGLASCTPPVAVDGEGNSLSATGTAVDAFGRAAEATVGVRIDRTAPTIAGGPTTPPNSAGTYGGPVTVRWACADALAGVLWCSGEQTIAALGTHTVTGAAVDLAGNAATKTVTFTIVDPTGTLSGRALAAADDAPIAGAQIRLYDASTLAVVGTTTTASDGRYAFADRPAGMYTVDVIAYGYRVLTKAGLVLPRTTPVNLKLAAAAPTPGIKGRITSSATGKAVAGVEVQLHLLGSPQLVGTTVTGADGRYHLPGLPAGKYQLRFGRAGYRTVWYGTGPEVVVQDLSTPVTARTSCTGKLNASWGDPCAQVVNEALPPA